jgi:hypothetical protein
LDYCRQLRKVEQENMLALKIIFKKSGNEDLD